MISQRAAFLVLLACILVYITGLFIPLMEIDAAQYASISREMLDNKSYLQIYDLGKDYLDKPPMLFWLSALSMKIFGVHSWSYRLPSLLFALLAVYSTYRLAFIFYKKEIAQLSALVLASCQAMFLINHDVRTDTMLMGWVALSIWQLAAWYEFKKWKNFLIAFIAIAGGMMTKGPIALMVPVFAFMPHFILRREWKQFFRWEYILGIIIIGVLLIPMSIGLYEQYDLHPGKIIDRAVIKSGLRFFYWTQSFGRITGESQWKENSSFFFLLQNMLWSFLPWIMYFLVALFLSVQKAVKQKFHLVKNQEFISAGGFIITYCALGSSQAQLPHYIFVAFPLAAIVTGNFLYQLYETKDFVKLKKPFFVFQVVVYIILWCCIIMLLAVVFESVSMYTVIACFLVCLGMFPVLFADKNSYYKLPEASFYTIIAINLFLNISFYPALLKYQAGNTAADFVNAHALPREHIFIYGMNEGRTMDFYTQHIYQHKTDKSQFNNHDIIMMPSDSVASVKKDWPQMKTLFTGPDFHVTGLTLQFLNPLERDSVVKKYVIAELVNK